jgi:hypothetical protein
MEEQRLLALSAKMAALASTIHASLINHSPITGGAMGLQQRDFLIQ